MSTIKRTKSKNSCQSKEMQIAFLKNKLFLCNREINELKLHSSSDNVSDSEREDIEYNLKNELNKKLVIKEKLTALGIIEKRGRPKKNNTEKYGSTRDKFTAMLKPSNLDYLKKIKAEKKIKNISAFLDVLIENHAYNYQM